jgi:hypothetical protein
VALRVYEAGGSLLQFPRLGRSGRKRGARELVLSGLPFLAISRVCESVFEIARILHGARRWPQPEGQKEEAFASERDSVFDYDCASHESWRFFALRHRVPLRHFAASVRM